MSLPQPIRRSFNRVTMLGITGLLLSGCVADMIAPLSVAAHRYPSARQAIAISRPPRANQVVYDDPAVTSDRLPTAREIFDLHPRGYDPEKMRQPFILDPHEGPLRISRLSQIDAATAETIRANQSEAASRLAALRPVLPPALPRNPAAAAVADPIGHQ